MKKILRLFLISVFLHSSIMPVQAELLAPKYLCETGAKFYQQGKYDEALKQFRKALIVSPDYQPALKYIRMLQGEDTVASGQKIASRRPIYRPASGAMRDYLELFELEEEMIRDRQRESSAGMVYPVSLPAVSAEPQQMRVIWLDKIRNKELEHIEMEQGDNIVILGKNISRFLVTEPRVMEVEKKGPDELLLTAKQLGYTYVHIWDDGGRATGEFLVLFPKPREAMNYEEQLRRQIEKARNFKLRYSLDWYSYETGRRMDTLRRSTYSWAHNLRLNGETPYGNLDSALTIRTLTGSTDLTYATIGITDGKLGPFKGFELRGLDYNIPFSNLALSGTSLRGGILKSPAFNNKLDYTAFWGREGGGRYGDLSPGLVKTRNSFLDGFNLNYSPQKWQNYKFTLAHGWGRDRDNLLNRYDYDLSGDWIFDKWGMGYEIANDSERFAHIFRTRYTKPKAVNFNLELRNIDRNFHSITSSGWRAGEIGGLISLGSSLTDKLALSSSLDVYRDRLYPALDNPKRLNEDFNFNLNYQADLNTSVTLNYILQNDLGRLSQYRYQSPSIGISKKIKFFKDISTYVYYYHQRSQNYASPAADYINERANLGLRFSLIGQLYYYLRREMNWVDEVYYGTHSKPSAWETGLDYSNQLGKSPFYLDFRFTYRDEKDTVSNLTFLSGEDYIEGYSQLTYRPSDNTEFYGSCRVRNVWADNPIVAKRIEANFNAGMRYFWDTGVHWDAIGDIDGYVFKDYNSDGLRQRDEPPVEGVKLWLSKDRSAVSDIFGYYRFKGVRARKAYVALDSTTLPPGFTLTVPAMQEVAIAHHRSARVDFGIISRSDIFGVLFEDIDGNG
ncbi:MAG: pilus assembly protein N-terminal domain-containing protein, partial [Candidatus Omnitrophica bacterium]|nr:pilus assembly protein N-terminal domain-containing protein [Candidatus Omnitrophota bacterium]